MTKRRRQVPFFPYSLFVYAVFFLGVTALPLRAAGPTVDSTPTNPSKWDNFPIAAYDSDTGLGGGVKSFLLNRLGIRESLDLTLYASTLGERWMRLVVSRPDFGLRQGTAYPLALDLKIEYDRMIRSHFYGVGNQTRSQDLETFNKVPFTAETTASHAFSSETSVRFGLRYRRIVDSRWVEGGLLEAQGYPSAGRAEYTTAFLSFQLDTRDSYLRPSRGWWLEAVGEAVPAQGWGNTHFARWETTFRRYLPLRSFRSVAAFRFQLQGLDRRDLPVQTLLSLGGGGTLRGYSQDRFLGSASALANAELRFPLYKRFGWIAGFDAGKVWDSFAQADLSGWAFNPVAGLRFCMDTFTVRGDLGFSREGTGLYLNFDQVI